MVLRECLLGVFFVLFVLTRRQLLRVDSLVLLRTSLALWNEFLASERLRLVLLVLDDEPDGSWSSGAVVAAS